MPCKKNHHFNYNYIITMIIVHLAKSRYISTIKKPGVRVTVPFFLK